MRSKGAGLLALAAALLCMAGQRADAAELHIGAMAHNICVGDCKNADLEAGPDIDVQLTFNSPSWLEAIGSPQPYLLVSANTRGNTSYAAAGLEWSIRLGEGWSFDPSFGYAMHDGELENPFAPGTPEAAAFSEAYIQFGSRDLFRTSFALTRRLSPRWEAQVIYAHLSHGQILGQGRNQGLDQIGVRFGYRFGAP